MVYLNIIKDNCNIIGHFLTNEKKNQAFEAFKHI